MIDATVSRVRLSDLTVLGRSRPAEPGGAGLHRPSPAGRRAGTDATRIAAVTPTRPSTPSSRPGTDDPVASTI